MSPPIKESGFFSFRVEMSVKRDDLGKDAHALPGTRCNPQAPLGLTPGAARDAGATAPSGQKAQCSVPQMRRAPHSSFQHIPAPPRGGEACGARWTDAFAPQTGGRPSVRGPPRPAP